MKLIWLNLLSWYNESVWILFSLLFFDDFEYKSNLPNILLPNWNFLSDWDF
jgi:hypothetical protein